MDTNQILIGIIAVCIVLTIVITFSNIFKLIGKFLLNGILGVLIIYLINVITQPEQVMVGVNLLTFIITGVLGFPGIVLLYLIQAFI